MVGLGAALIMALVQLSGCSAWLVDSAQNSADDADKAQSCALKADGERPPAGQIRAGDPVWDTLYNARAQADVAADVAKQLANGETTALIKADADQKAAAAAAKLASLPPEPFVYKSGGQSGFQRPDGSCCNSLPTGKWIQADQDSRNAAQRAAIITDLLVGKDKDGKDKGLDSVVASADQAADEATKAAAEKFPECRRQLEKSRPDAFSFANRDLSGSQGGRKGPSGGGGGGHPSGGGGGGGGGGPEGP